MNNRDRHSKRHNSNWKNSNGNTNTNIGNKNSGGSHQDQKRSGRGRFSQHSEHFDSKASDEAIREFKANNRPECLHCGQPIVDMSQAIMDRSGKGPIHFDCALEILGDEEKISQGDRITYIGQGRFGVLYFPNVHDMKHFTIKKIIDWEEKESKPEWRNKMADLFSHVK